MKTSITFISVLLSGICLTAISQPMNPGYKNKADSLRDEGNLKEAAVEYKNLLRNNPGDRDLLYNYSCVLSLYGQNDSSFKYLEEYMKRDTSVRILTDPDFCPLRRDKRWEAFENKVIGQFNVKYNNPFHDVAYAKQLWRFSAQDQVGFSEIGIASRKTGPNSSVVRGIWECKFIIGEKNQREMDELLTRKGWPRIADVGREAAVTAWMIVMHSNSALIQKYLPAIKQACMDKELPWERYASIYDRALWFDNKPQHYGTHTRMNEATGKEELYPLEDAAMVDEWRKELGLEPLKDYLSRMYIVN